MNTSSPDRQTTKGSARSRKRPVAIVAPMPGIGIPSTVRNRQPDREARSLLRFLNSFSFDPSGVQGVGEMRKQWRVLALALGRRAPVASVTNLRIEGPGGPIELRVYAPGGAPGLKPGFLWCHGGGFVTGGFDSADAICRNVARAAGAVVVAVRYRLAPEHDLYAGREDFLAALDWAAEHGAAVGIDSSRLAIGGDSAGGNICAAVAQACLQRGGPALRLQVLVYPATNLQADYPSKAENARGYFLTAAFMDWVRPVIFSPSMNLADPWLSPICSPDLQGLPPALVITAGFDPVRDDGLDYAARLRAASVPVELLHYPGQFHGFLNFDSMLGAARDALRRIGDALAGAGRDDAPADRTIEISDDSVNPRQAVLEATSELAISTLMAGRAARQWAGTLTRLVSPTLASAWSFVLNPLWVPVALLRRGATARLVRQAARQTYPAPGAGSPG